MKYDKELIEIVKKKEFKTFWHCLDFLLMAGYNPMDAFGVSMKEFGESKIYSNVAFIRIEQVHHEVRFTGQNRPRAPKQTLLIVGLIDDSNIHLSGLYGTYREWLTKGVFFSSPPETAELEDTCEIIKVSELTPFIINYLRSVSKLHFGYEAFGIPEVTNQVVEADVPHDPNDREYWRRILERGAQGFAQDPRMVTQAEQNRIAANAALTEQNRQAAERYLRGQGGNR
jgi:hypothetical protein